MGTNGIYGLSGSGLDVESLVKMGMLNKQNQYDKMEQKEIYETWQKEAYNGVYKDIGNYYNSLSTYKMQSNMNAMQASSNNISAVSATANGAAAAMNHTISVSDVASNAYLQSKEGVTRDGGTIATSTYLRDVIFKKVETGKDAQGNYSYDVTFADGTKKSVNGSDIAISLTIQDEKAGDPANITTYKLEYTYDQLMQDDKTLSDFASAFSKSGANIQGNYDTTNDSFSLYNKTSGSKNIIGIAVANKESATLMNNLHLAQVDSVNNTMGSEIDFSAEPTTSESKVIENSAISTSLKDVLGLKADLVKNGEDDYTLTFTQADGTKTILENKTLDELKNAQAFSMNLSDGANNTTVGFTYADLFDMDSEGSLKAKASLNTLADKINAASSAAGMSVVAAYDEGNDSFSLKNTNGGAILTADSSDAVGTKMVSALNLNSVVNPTMIGVAAGDESKNLADLLGVKAVLSYDGQSGNNRKFSLTLQDSSGNALKNSDGSIIKFSGVASDFLNGTTGTGSKASKQTALTLTVGDGTGSSADVSLTFGDLFDFSSIKKNGTFLELDSKVVDSKATMGASKAADQQSLLADKINAAVGGSLDVVADVDGGLELLSKRGTVSLTDSTLGSVLTTGKFPSRDASAKYAELASGTIAREKATSTGDSLKDVLGFSADYVKNDDGSFTVTVKNSAGNESVFKGTSDVLAGKNLFNLKITDTDDISIKLGDLVDLSGMTSSGGSLDAKMSLDDLADKITAIGDKVSASYDSDARKLTIKNTAGEAGLALDSPDITGLGAQLASKLSVSETKESADAKKTGVPTQSEGTNAKAVIDGKEYDLDTNRVTVAGVTYTITGKTDRAVVSVTQDTDKIVDFVKNFVDAYNTLIDSLNDKLSEKKYSDYKPLSSRQEEEMTEKQIEKWTEKAKSGLLYNDSTIRNLVSAMREALYTRVDAVDSEYNTMSSIGITTTTTKGHITFSEDKLRKALAEDPDCAYQLFASDQDSSYIAGSTSKKPLTENQKRSDYANTGVASRLYNVMSEYKTKISDIAGVSTETNDQSYLGKMITQMQNKMSTFKTMMNAYEKQLFKRYDAMEVALSKLGMQLNYITGYNS